MLRPSTLQAVATPMLSVDRAGNQKRLVVHYSNTSDENNHFLLQAKACLCWTGKMIGPPTATTYAASVKPVPSSDVSKESQERQRPTARLRTARRIQRQNMILQPKQCHIGSAASSCGALPSPGSAVFIGWTPASLWCAGPR